MIVKNTRKKIWTESTIVNSLDLGFLPKELLYDESNFDDSNKKLMSALDVLENAQKGRKVKEEKKEENFWDKVGNFFMPFKCGSDQ